MLDKHESNGVLFVVDKYTIRLEIVRIVELGIMFFIYKLMCY